MVVCDFDFVGMAFLPLKTDPVLLVNSDAVLSFSIPREALQPVAWWNYQLSQHTRAVDLIQFSLGNPPNPPWAAPSGCPRINTVEDISCTEIGKGSNHGSYYNG